MKIFMKLYKYLSAKKSNILVSLIIIIFSIGDLDASSKLNPLSKGSIISKMLQETVTAEKEEEKYKTEKSPEASSSDTLEKIQPRLGILPKFTMSLDNSIPNLVPGFRGILFFDVRIPMSKKKLAQLDFRMGISMGATWMGASSGKVDDSLLGLPLMVNAKLGYTFDIGLKPYFNFAYGGTYLIYGSNESGISLFNSTLECGLGLSYTNQKIPHIEFILLDVNFYLISEHITGYFISAGVGIAFNFGKINKK